MHRRLHWWALSGVQPTTCFHFRKKLGSDHKARSGRKNGQWSGEGHSSYYSRQIALGKGCKLFKSFAGSHLPPAAVGERIDGERPRALSDSLRDGNAQVLHLKRNAATVSPHSGAFFRASAARSSAIPSICLPELPDKAQRHKYLMKCIWLTATNLITARQTWSAAWCNGNKQSLCGRNRTMWSAAVRLGELLWRKHRWPQFDYVIPVDAFDRPIEITNYCRSSEIPIPAWSFWVPSSALGALLNIYHIRDSVAQATDV